jgi:hypothetical protein
MTKSNNTLKANKDLPLITDLEVNSILDSLILGKTSIEIAKDLQIPLTKLYKILDQDAPKVSSFFVEKQQQNIKTDQTITIKFDSGIDEKVIELDPEKFEFTPSTSSTEVKD